jgi:basic amino acid/polyamine antiporter, APA family
MPPADAPSLERKLSLFPVTNIVIANMVGVGIFTTSGLLISDLGSPALMIALWAVGGGIAVCGALSYGVLGAAMPQAGGEYLFLSRLYHPAVGFLSGWVSFVVGFSAPIAASAIGFSEYLVRAFPGILTWGEGIRWLDPVMVKKLLAVAVILTFTLVHLRGVEFGSSVQNVLTVLKLGFIIVLILVGFLLGSGDAAHFSEGRVPVLDFRGWKTIGLSLMWIMFAYSGWNASTYIGSEIRNPSRTLPRSLILGTGVVVILYLGLNALYVYAVDPEQMGGVVSIGGLAMEELFGRSMEIVSSLLIAVALVSSLSAFIILGPRVYFSMASDGYFFRSVAEIHPRFGVPAKSILLQSAIAVLMALTGTFDQVLTYMGFSLGIFPILAVGGVLRLKRPPDRTLHLNPAVPVLFILCSSSMLTLAYFERPVESSIALATVLAGLPAFLLFRRAYRTVTPAPGESRRVS